MPSKKTLAEILRKGGPNPFAVANAMENKGQIKGRKKKEEVIQAITREALKPKRKRKK